MQSAKHILIPMPEKVAGHEKLSTQKAASPVEKVLLWWNNGGSQLSLLSWQWETVDTMPATVVLQNNKT